MYNNDEKISASEINKYCYCEYSWYYERLYGKKYIRERHKERNDKLEFRYVTINNFKRGIEFHDKFHDKYINKRKIKIITRFIVFIILISIFTFIILWLKKCGLL